MQNKFTSHTPPWITGSCFVGTPAILTVKITNGLPVPKSAQPLVSHAPDRSWDRNSQEVFFFFPVRFFQDLLRRYRCEPTIHRKRSKTGHFVMSLCCLFKKVSGAGVLPLTMSCPLAPRRQQHSPAWSLPGGMRQVRNRNRVDEEDNNVKLVRRG